MGGTRGDLVFTVAAVNTPGKKIPKSEDEDEDEVFLGEGEALPHAFGKKPAGTKKKGKTKAKPLAKAAADKANKSLFDLKPLFMGIQADRKRRRGIFGKCILGLNEIVLGSICNSTMLKAHKAKKKKGSEENFLEIDEVDEAAPAAAKKKKKSDCPGYILPPMSDAMQTLYRNARTNYCKYSSKCDATMCYTYPGPVDRKTGLMSANYQEFKDQPIWITHNQTLVGNNTVALNQTKVWVQLVSFKIELEKVNFCEKINPPVQTVDGSLKTMSCFTSRRCRMVELTRGKCRDGTSDMATAPLAECPKDTLFKTRRKAKEQQITPMLCAQM